MNTLRHQPAIFRDRPATIPRQAAEMNAEVLTGYILLIAVFLILAVVMVASFVQ